MKLIIKISDESYDKALNGIINCKECFDAIVYGTPIPDNATNGDVIKAIFPNTHMEYRMWTENLYFYETDWWNAPYQKGGKL